jgi:hypothetical protein
MRRTVAFATFALVLLAAPAARPDDANFEFSKTANPTGPWTYGWSNAMTGTFTAFTTETNFSDGLSRWSAPNGASLSMSCSPVTNEPGTTMLGGVLSARLGSGGELTTLRWTAPTIDNWHLRATFVSATGYFPQPTQQGVTYDRANSQFGTGVAIGDVNGDGYGDLLVGAPAYTNSQSNEGNVLLYYGSATGFKTPQVFAYESNVVNMQAGWAVAMGDINGDGKQDFVFGMPPASGGFGAVRIYLGSASGPVFSTQYTSGSTGDATGKAIAIGDFNHDGYADVVLGKVNSNVCEVSYGSAAGPGSFSDLVLPPATRATVVANVGDVNGDGYPDLLVGSPAVNTNAGAAAVFLGAASGISNAPIWSVAGMAGSRFGWSAAPAGDVNHDGYADFVVGGYSESVGGGSLNGRVRLYRGGASGPSTTPSWTLDGASLSETGYSLAYPGDLNADGYPDLVVGAPTASNGQSGEGQTLVFFGTPSGTPTLHATYEMNQVAAQVGIGLACGDVNGDGVPDIAEGAPYYDNGALGSAGRVAVIMNAGGPPPPFARTSVRGQFGGVTMAQDTLNTATGRDTVTLEVSVAANAGQALDIQVGDAGGVLAYEAVGVDASVEPVTPPKNPAGPVLTLGGQRYVPIQGPPGFEAAAFDPLARQLASNGHLYDVCGGDHAPGPEGPGIAWDPVTRKFWNIFFDAGNQRWVVASWDTTSQALTAVFTIPRVLMVPGTGADTLEDARGLAVDSSFVYVVDAGPANLVPPANAWFKFSRAGLPIASLKGAAFAANQTYDIVDDIVYSPFASPVEPGRFLVAIEHLGILVFDANGALRDSSTWRGQNLPRASSPSAFAGLALDPVTGDLFLADNDRSKCTRWMRLPDDGPTTYLVGDNDPAAMILPFTECQSANALLPDPIEPKSIYCPVTPFIFGVAYRTVDQRVYAIDYGTGTLWKFDPRGGRGSRVGEVGITGIWGLAYDTVRDVLYGGQTSIGTQVFRINPRTAVPTPLPQVTPYTVADLAFEPNGGAIYGMNGIGGAGQLIRIDRDTGAGTVVGQTKYVAGLEYDPVRGALLGTWSNDTLLSINPATAAASVVGRIPWTVGWEGLAVVPVGIASNTDVPVAPVRGVTGPALALAVTPQPSRGDATLAFALFETARVRLDIYDVAGRHVRRVVDAAFAPGAHSVAWDGRGEAGGVAAAGIYFARLEAGGRSVTARVVRVR